MEQERRAGAAPDGPPRPAPGWRSSGPDRPAWRPPSGWPTRASASRSSRSTRTPAGMVGGAIPAYRLPQAQIDQDLAVLERLGVEIRYGVSAGVDVTLEALRSEGFAAIFIAVGAQRAKRLGLPGEDARGRDRRRDLPAGRAGGRPAAIGPRVGVVGAGDTAMDCVRSARRVGASSVSLDLSPDGRPDAGRPGGDPRHPGGGHRDRRAGPAGRPPRRGRPAGRGRVPPDRVRRNARRRGPQGSARRPGLRVRDRPGHPGPRDQPARGARLLRRPAAGADRGRLHRGRPGHAGDVDPAGVRRWRRCGRRASLDRAGRRGRQAGGGGHRRRVRGVAGGCRGRRPARRAEESAPAPTSSRSSCVAPGASTACRSASARSTAATGFEETVLGYTAEEAMREASRCLDCDTDLQPVRRGLPEHGSHDL